MSRQLSATLVAGVMLSVEEAAALAAPETWDPADGAMTLVEMLGYEREDGLSAFPAGTADDPEAIVVGVPIARVEFDGAPHATRSSVDLEDTFARAARALAAFAPGRQCRWHLVAFET